MFIYNAQQTPNTLESAYLFLFDIFFFVVYGMVYTMKLYTEYGTDRCKI